MRLILLSIAFLFSSSMFAQVSNELKLKGNNFIPEENIDDYVATAQLSRKDLTQRRYYKLIQFNEMPTKAELKTIADLGINLVSYVPNKAYVASLPQSLDPQELKSINVRYIHNISQEMKLSYRLQENDIPSWAHVDRNRIEVNIMYPEDLEQKSVLALAKSEGIVPKDYNTVNNFFTAFIELADVRRIADLPFVHYMELRQAPSIPDDTPGRALLRANMIDTQSPMGRKYDGSGVAVLCRDDGEVFDHVDFHGRIFQEFVGENRGNHGDGVSGIMAGSGNKDPKNRGLAAGSDLYVIDYQANFLDETMSLHRNQNVLVTNSSYSNGCNDGYTNTTRTVDQQCYQNESLMHVFSAGNSNNQECGYGAGDQWGNITGGHKQGKNVLTTANVTNQGVIVESSSRGPAHDGRIKPDISSNGVNHISTNDFHSYRPFGGTSGAAPGIAGVIAMLHQAYRENNNGEIANAALLKSIMLNTADDLGNKGPDFIFGWGAANAYRSALAVENKSYETGIVGQNDSKSHLISVPAGARELRVMTYWADFAEILELPAEKGTDNLNNMEQVYIENPAAGDYTLDVFGLVIPQAEHNYIVTWEIRMDEITMVFPYGGEKMVENDREIINWESAPNGESYTISFSSDGGATWLELAAAGANAQSVEVIIPKVNSGQAHIKLTRGAEEVISEPFTVTALPKSLKILEVCGNDMLVSWDPVPDATSYDVHVLGSKFMQFGLNTTSTQTRLPISNPFLEQWFAVSANFDNDVKGRRSIAVNHDGEGLVNCKLDFDLTMSSVDNPTADHLITCAETIEIPCLRMILSTIHLVHLSR